MNTMSISKMSVSGNRFECVLNIDGEVAKAFRKPAIRFYYEANIDLEGLPVSIGVVPLLAQIIPISWYFDAKISVPECDRDFAESVPNFKAGYMQMHPKLKLSGGSLEVEKIVTNERELKGAVCLFSGGLDAHDTAIRHADEKPSLLVVQGSDIGLKNEAAWKIIVGRVDEMAQMLGGERLSVKSNFRHMLNYKYLDSCTAQIADTWWHSMQYGIGLVTLAAPVAWMRGIGKVYIASSFSEDSKGTYSCASDPIIDNHVRFFGACVEHDGYQCGRIDKIRNIAAWRGESGKKVYLRVCAHRPVTGRNCCTCEKCWRTMLAIYALKMDPTEFGFEYSDFGKIIDTMHRRAYLVLRNYPTRYLPIIQLMRKNYKPEEVRPDLKWLYDIDISPDCELFKWINARVIEDRARIKRAQERAKGLSKEVERLEKENAELKQEIADFKASSAYRLYRVTRARGSK